MRKGFRPKNSARVRTRLLHIDAQPIFCQGFAKLMSEHAEFQMCGQAANATTALEAIEKLVPDLVLMDISLMGVNGIELIKMVKARYPRVRILVLSELDELDYGERALRAGADGYVMKQTNMEEVMRAIGDVLRGETYLSKRMQSRMVQKFLGKNAGNRRSGLESLSDRELEIFELIGKGYKTKEAAIALHLSVKTIETHRAHIKEKLKLKDGTDLVRHAVRWVDVREQRTGFPDAVQAFLKACGPEQSGADRASEPGVIGP